jgi:SAM-dependent methyltransferase
MSDTIPVDPSNADQQRAWDEGEGLYWAAHAEQFDRGMAGYQPFLLASADIAPTARVLDIGCGAGQTSRDAARIASSGSVLGVDLSTQLLEVARQAADDEGLRNVSFRQGDAQVYPFERASFDVALSRTGVMFFGDEDAAFTNIAGALRPGGRLALAVWQGFRENEWFGSFVAALAAGRDLQPPPPRAPSPFALSEPDRVRPLLTSTGFTDIGFESVRRPMGFGPTAGAAYEFVLGLLGWMLTDLDAEGRSLAQDNLRSTMQAHEGEQGVRFGSAMWLITATRS